MRTTVNIDDDVLLAARSLAERERKSVGEVLSALARLALKSDSSARPAPKSRNGVPLLPRGPHAKPVTMELVNQLRDELR